MSMDAGKANQIGLGHQSFRVDNRQKPARTAQPEQPAEQEQADTVSLGPTTAQPSSTDATAASQPKAPAAEAPPATPTRASVPMFLNELDATPGVGLLQNSQGVAPVAASGVNGVGDTTFYFLSGRVAATVDPLVQAREAAKTTGLKQAPGVAYAPIEGLCGPGNPDFLRFS